MFRIGDKVSLNTTRPKYAGHTYVVDKVNPTTYLVRDTASNLKVRAPHDMVMPVNNGDLPPCIEDVPIHEHLDQGTIIRYVGHKAWHNFRPGDLGVVIKDRTDLVNIVKLGGDSGYYLRVMPSHVEKLTLAELRDALNG